MNNKVEVVKFTTVLVTQPSRLLFFAQMLNSAQTALLMHPEMQLLVIFNGVNSEGLKLVQKLKIEFLNRIQYIVIEKNSPMPVNILNYLADFELDWVHFPGDDDLLNPEKYHLFKDAISSRPDTVAVGFSAVAIDSFGNQIGKTLKPLDLNGKSISRKIALGLHRPPFVWPSLIFKLSILPKPIYNSRFVFDWWVGLNVLCCGNVICIDQPIIFYRVHSNQESYQVSNSRKRFEAMLMLENFILKQGFLEKLYLDSSREEFFGVLVKSKPIYGDPRFGTPILLLLNNILRHSSTSKGVPESELIFQYAATQGVFLRRDEIAGFHPRFDRDSPEINFRFNVGYGVCTSVRKCLSTLMQSSGPDLGVVECLHSLPLKDRQRVIVVDCSKTSPSLLDSLSAQLITWAENSDSINGRVSMTLAPWEQRLLAFLQRLLKQLRLIKIQLTKFF